MPTEAESTKVMRWAIERLAENPEANRLLAKTPLHVTAEDIRRLFRLNEELDAKNDSTTLARSRGGFRSFVFMRAHTLSFGEQIDPQRVRFKPALPTPRSESRALISDLHDISDFNSNVPVGALAANTAKDLVNAVKTRTEYDLKRIRDACIADMSSAAALRKRAIVLRSVSMSQGLQSTIREALRNTHTAARDLTREGVTPDQVLIGALKCIHAEGLATDKCWSDGYCIPFSEDVRAKFQESIAGFKSWRLLEIEYRACVEELFAAFHLLHTHVGWNWSSVMALQVDNIDLSTTGAVVLQSYKSKTDDDTPVASIDFSEPGVQMAVDLLLWNRSQLVKCGFLDPADKVLWVTRPRQSNGQRAGYFHPTTRLKTFIQRHALPNYSFDQVRTQYLFSLSLQKGGVEAARLKGGHASYGVTERYVGNIVQDRISSALNLEFSKRLEKEIRYLYRGGKRNSTEISLLRPIGDGASCVNPAAAPPGRSKSLDSCSAEACHIEGGCPNRRIVIDDDRVEETLRLNRHFIENWHRLLQENPERFVAQVAPNMAFNAALLLALQRGPYAVRVMQVSERIGIQ